MHIHVFVVVDACCFRLRICKMCVVLLFVVLVRTHICCVVGVCLWFLLVYILCLSCLSLPLDLYVYVMFGLVDCLIAYCLHIIYYGLVWSLMFWYRYVEYACLFHALFFWICTYSMFSLLWCVMLFDLSVCLQNSGVGMVVCCSLSVYIDVLWLFRDIGRYVLFVAMLFAVPFCICICYMCVFVVCCSCVCISSMFGLLRVP